MGDDVTGMIWQGLPVARAEVAAQGGVAREAAQRGGAQQRGGGGRGGRHLRSQLPHPLVLRLQGRTSITRSILTLREHFCNIRAWQMLLAITLRILAPRFLS